MTAYYNEHDKFAAQWLRNLIDAGHLPAGDVDERSIRDVDPSDLDRYTSCHFFAGIGGWPLALRMAGWPDDRPVWTGSCPCQPFSSAGSRKGTDDERHLWPELLRLLRERQPSVIMGEQVASPDGLAWLDVVSTDLENENYAFRAADLCAAGVGAPHKRQRLFWMGDADSEQRKGYSVQLQPGRPLDEGVDASRDDDGSGMGDADVESAGRVGRAVPRAQAEGDSQGGEVGYLGDGSRDASAPCNWSDPDWVYCKDPSGPRWRPVEPGTFPLADGIPGRVGRLRAYWNAIVPQVACEFILSAFPELTTPTLEDTKSQ